MDQAYHLYRLTVMYFYMFTDTLREASFHCEPGSSHAFAENYIKAELTWDMRLSCYQKQQQH